MHIKQENPHSQNTTKPLIKDIHMLGGQVTVRCFAEIEEAFKNISFNCISSAAHKKEKSIIASVQMKHFQSYSAQFRYREPQPLHNHLFYQLDSDFTGSPINLYSGWSLQTVNIWSYILVFVSARNSNLIFRDVFYYLIFVPNTAFYQYQK